MWHDINLHELERCTCGVLIVHAYDRLGNNAEVFEPDPAGDYHLQTLNPRYSDNTEKLCYVLARPGVIANDRWRRHLCDV